MIIGRCRGPGWQVFHADLWLSRRIRGWITSAISGHDCPVDAADAALVVTELFSNAVRHGPAGGRVLVGYCLWQQGARLVVCDRGGPGTPRLVEGGQLAEGGRGLHVVDSLAARWGSFRPAGALASHGLVGVRPVRPWPPGGCHFAGHADWRTKVEPGRRWWNPRT